MLGQRIPEYTSTIDIFEANRTETKHANINDSFYRDFEPYEGFQGVLTDFNIPIHGVKGTDWKAETVLENGSHEELEELLEDDFNSYWSPEDKKLRIIENLTDFYRMVETAKENGVDVYVPDNVFHKVGQHIEKPENMSAEKKTIKDSLFRYLIENTRLVRYSQLLLEEESRNAGHLYRTVDEDAVISQLADEKNAVVATYDSDFVNRDDRTPGFTPRQIELMIDKGYHEES